MGNSRFKFRVWCKQTEEMQTVEKMGFNEDGLWYVEDEDHDSQPPYFVGSDDWALMQYTGLKDKNGKEIYEGDINFNGGLVIFKDGAFLLKTKSGQDMLVKYQLEIIGNIYEDYPELLEG